MAKVGELPDDWRGSATEVAELLEVSDSTVRRYRETGRLVPDKIRGNRSYYTRDCVREFVWSWFSNPDRGVRQ